LYIASLIDKCWLGRLDLDYEDDITFIEQERGSISIKRRRRLHDTLQRGFGLQGRERLEALLEEVLPKTPVASSARTEVVVSHVKASRSPVALK
jgi:hypothetical protein